MSALLAIDTAAPRLQLALLVGERVDTVVEVMPQGQAERLFPALGELLDRNGIGYRDLRRIAVTTGPGSFTGLRIGLSAARGLGLALDIPVLGIPTLLALALVAPDERTAVVLDARRGEAYAQKFDTLRPLTAPALLPIEKARAVEPGVRLLDSPFVDIVRLARFARDADPASYQPDATYIRGADAKPQERFRVARQ